MPLPFSSERTRSAYVDSDSLFIISRRRGVAALSKVGCSFMIGSERWMRCARELDSNKNKIVASVRAGRAISDRGVWRARFRRAAALANRSRLQEADRLPFESPVARTIQRCRCAFCEETRREISARF